MRSTPRTPPIRLERRPQFQFIPFGLVLPPNSPNGDLDSGDEDQAHDREQDHARSADQDQQKADDDHYRDRDRQQPPWDEIRYLANLPGQIPTEQRVRPGGLDPAFNCDGHQQHSARCGNRAGQLARIVRGHDERDD
jgi:hypothetical protein